MPTDIDSLQIKIESDSTSAVKGVDALANSLSKLKNAVQGGSGLSTTAKNIEKINNAVKGLDSGASAKISSLATGLTNLGNLGNIKISSSIGNQIQRIAQAVRNITQADINRLNQLATAVNNIGNAKIGNVAGSINSISRAARNSNTTTTNTATTTKIIGNNNKVIQSFSNLKNSAINTYAKIKLAYASLSRIADMIGGFINKSTEYIEDLNLFNASMGKYASEAQAYAEKVGEIMGIDPGQWMRNQGIFNIILTGFGVVEDRAYTMSQQLTQLGYDISSFFNLSYEESMAKLESGIAGELEPLRRIGYDLSVARLQQEAYALGINKSVSAMNQAEKAELRYHAIMTQVLDSHGDMARTLEAPANQLRIFRAQLDMTAREIGNIFIPVLNMILPYAIAAIKGIRGLAQELANFFGFELPEVDYSSLEAIKSAAAEVNDNLVDTSDLGGDIADTAADIADSAGDLGDGLGDAAKQAKKLKSYMLGIDELNVIQEPEDAISSIASAVSGKTGKTGSGSSGGVGGLNDGSVGGWGLGIDLPTYDFLGDAIAQRIEDTGAEIKQKIQDMLDSFGSIITAVGLASIGAGLLFILVGQPLLGIGMVLAGAALLAAQTVNWTDGSSTKDQIMRYLGSFAVFAGLAAVGMGLLFLITGNVPLGMGMVIGGIAALAIGSAVLKTKDDSTYNKMKTLLGTFANYAGLAAVGLGMLLMVVGKPLIGLALILGGAALLASNAVLNSSDSGLKDNIFNFLASFANLAGLALFGAGLLMLLLPGQRLIGLGLMVAGAGAIAVSMVDLGDGGDIKDKLTQIFSKMLLLTGATALAVGAVLCLIGDIPHGLGLMLLGGAALTASGVLDPQGFASTINKALTKTGSLLKGLDVKLSISSALGILPSELDTELRKLEKSEDPKVRLGAGLIEGTDAAVKGDLVGMIKSLPAIFANVGAKADEKQGTKDVKENLKNIINNLGVTSAVLGVTMDTVTAKASISEATWTVKKYAEQKAKIEYAAIMEANAGDNLTKEVLLTLKDLPSTDITFQYKAALVGGEANLRALIAQAQAEVDKTPLQIGTELQESALREMEKKLGSNVATIAKNNPLKLFSEMVYQYNNTFYHGDKQFVDSVLGNLQKFYDNDELLAKLGIDKDKLQYDAETQYNFLSKLFQQTGSNGLNAKIGADVTEADRKATGFLNTLIKEYGSNRIYAILDSNTLNAEEKAKQLTQLLQKATGGKYTYSLTADGSKAISTNTTTFNTMSEFIRKHPGTFSLNADGKTANDKATETSKQVTNIASNTKANIGLTSGWVSGQTPGSKITAVKKEVADSKWWVPTYQTANWVKGQTPGNVVDTAKTNAAKNNWWIKTYQNANWVQNGTPGNLVDIMKANLSKSNWWMNSYMKSMFANGWDPLTQYNNAINKIPTREVQMKISTTAINNATQTAMGMMGIYVPLAYASGGFPEEGQLFIAREAGAELVGSVGGRTAVANNDQIVEAVSVGVYNAVMSAMSQQNDKGSQDITISLDGEVIYKNQQKIARNKGYQLRQGAFA